jgi:cytidylate kinase
MPLITISQDYGSHGYYVAQRIAQELNLELHDDETLQEAAVRQGVTRKHLDAMKEQVPGFFDRHMGPMPDVYLDVLQKVVYQVSSNNNGVIVGHGGQVLLRDFSCALHIRIIAPAEKRVRYFIEEKGFEEEQARKIVSTKDEEAKDFFRYAFKMDINDPLLYDLVINTDKISIETTISHIIQLAQSNDIAECNIGALAIMQCRALELKIHAKLAQMDILLTGIKIEVEEPGKARVHGVVNSQAERKKIIKALKTISELKDTKVNIYVAPLYG